MDWDKKLFDEKGRPREDLAPEAWFSYIQQKAGGISGIATVLGISRQTIHANWNGRFPDKYEYVMMAQEAWGIPARLLAPDLFKKHKPHTPPKQPVQATHKPRKNRS